ncbi:MAG TPA: hypothetical protein VFG21_00865 [Xanthomonadaceae bacterium]|nr:hypothetical protein [Xanthomonadaceae bacterium]
MTGRPHLREVSRYGWFLRQPRYLRYMARELSCVFIGAYAAMLVVALVRLAEGRQAFEAFVHWLMQPASLVFHLFVLAFALYHTSSWFKLAPKAMPMQIGERFVPEAVIVGAHYALWLVLSLALLYAAGAF